jgi:hypothetical protein
MNAKPLLCLLGFLAFAGFSPQASGDDVIIGGPSPSSASLEKATKTPTTLLGKYKQYVYEVVGSYWYPAIDQASFYSSVGKVRIKFTIHMDGTLSDVEVMEGKQLVRLAAISLDALKAPQPFKPFTAELVKENGDKYTDDFTFSTFGKTGTVSPNSISGPSPYSSL